MGCVLDRDPAEVWASIRPFEPTTSPEALDLLRKRLNVRDELPVRVPQDVDHSGEADRVVSGRCEQILDGVERFLGRRFTAGDLAHRVRRAVPGVAKVFACRIFVAHQSSPSSVCGASTVGEAAAGGVGSPDPADAPPGTVQAAPAGEAGAA